MPDPAPLDDAAVPRLPAPPRAFARSLRQAVGLAIVVGGLLVGAQEAWRLAVAAGVQSALAGGALGALATALGTLPALLAGGLSARARDAMLGFGAGVMLAASSFSLIVPALAAAQDGGAGRAAASLTVGAAVVMGALVLHALDRWLMRPPPAGAAPRTAAEDRLHSVWLFVLAVMLHNVPEGLAVGTAMAAGDGTALAMGIAVQDVPEGLVIATALRAVGYGGGVAVLLGALSGLAEPIAAVGAALVVGTSMAVLPWALGAAAGAMLFVIGHAVIPESHRDGHGRLATAALVGGFVLMMVLDTALG